MTTTPEPAVSPAPALNLGEIRISPASQWLAWKRPHLKAWAIVSTEVGLLGLTAVSRLAQDAEVADWLPLVPVSPGDTETLRYRIAYALNEAVGEQLDGGTSLAAAADAVLPIVNEREAGLRADLDRARAEIERLAGMRAQYRHNWQSARDANHQALETIAELHAEVRRLKEYLLARRNALASLLGQPAVKEDIGWFDLCAQIEERLARSAGARTIPDGAAETVAAITHMHREFRIYTECDHQHDSLDDGEGVLEAAEIGLTCEAAYEYSICRECCTGGSDYQTEECVDSHQHSYCWPCTTHRLATGATPTTGPAPAAADELREEKGDLLCTLACAIDLLKTHVDDEDCSLDHHGYCQTHGWFDEDDCNVARTRAFLIGASWVPDFNAERFDWAEAAATLVHPAPAAPQAPESGPDCSHCRCARPFHKTCCPTEQAEPMASCGVHTEAEAQTSIRHELCTPAAREDTAPPDDYGDNVRVPGPLAPVTAPVSHWQDSEGSIWEEGDDGRLRLFEHRGERLTFHRPWCGRDEVTTLFGELSPLRPSAPPVDGDTPTATAPEES